MKKLNSKGFSAVEVLIIVVIVGVLGGVGWYVWNNKQKNDKLNAISTFAQCKADSSSKIQESFPEVCVTKNGKSFTNPDQKVETSKDATKDSTSSSDSSSGSTSDGYVTIKEWGIKIKLKEAEKVYFKVDNKPGEATFGKYDAVATPYFKSQYLQDKECTPGVALFRTKTIDDFFKEGATKIGVYYYIITGGPGACSNDPDHNPDDQLKIRFLHDFSTENIVEL